VNKNNN